MEFPEPKAEARYLFGRSDLVEHREMSKHLEQRVIAVTDENGDRAYTFRVSSLRQVFARVWIWQARSDDPRGRRTYFRRPHSHGTRQDGDGVAVTAERGTSAMNYAS